jgi:hypothetical protein
LVDRGELVGQQRIEDLDKFCIALHYTLLYLFVNTLSTGRKVAIIANGMPKILLFFKWEQYEVRLDTIPISEKKLPDLRKFT